MQVKCNVALQPSRLHGFHFGDKTFSGAPLVVSLLASPVTAWLRLHPHVCASPRGCSTGAHAQPQSVERWRGHGARLAPARGAAAKTKNRKHLLEGGTRLGIPGMAAGVCQRRHAETCCNPPDTRCCNDHNPTAQTAMSLRVRVSPRILRVYAPGIDQRGTACLTGMCSMPTTRRRRSTRPVI